MKFICSLVVVEDIGRARHLYEDLLGQKVIAEFGDNNVAFEGGLALYKRSLYQQLIGGERAIAHQANNFELYFEEDKLDEVARQVQEHGFEFVHGIREEPWRQRVFRFYDADRHIVVIAESMDRVAYRLSQEHHTIDDISRMTGVGVEEVAQQIERARQGVV